MVNNFAASQTYQNLQNAFNRELVASTKYQIYGDKARREGYQQIGNIFDETSGNEKQHAEIWLKFIIQSDQLPTTLTNLQDAAAVENYKGTDLYLQYAQVAREEGYTDIANMFEGIAVIERHHYFRFNSLANNIQNNQVFCKPNSAVWICMVCGNLVWDECAPEICPICGFPQAFYKLNCENF
ncbi:MAG: rubrerythrin family protein [Sedimentibacter sp.]